MESISTLDVGVVKEAVAAASGNSDNALKLESLNYQKALIKEEKEFEVSLKSQNEQEKILPLDVLPVSSIVPGAPQVRSDELVTKTRLTPAIAEALEVLASKSAVVAEVRMKEDVIIYHSSSYIPFLDTLLARTIR